MSTASLEAPLKTDLHVKIISNFDELCHWQTAWEDLIKQSSSNEPMLSPRWLLPWWKIYGQGRHLRVGIVFESEQVIGLIPLQLRCFWYRPGIPFRRLEFLGADVDEEDGVCSEYLNLIAAERKENKVLHAVKQQLVAGKFGAWDELVLAAMDGEHPLVSQITKAFTLLGFSCHLKTTTQASYVPLPNSWDEYLKQLGKNRRYVTKSLRDFEEWTKGKAVFHKARNEQELEAGKNALHALHAQRRQPAEQQGVFSYPRFVDFHNEVMNSFRAVDGLDLHWLTFNGRPLAALYSLRWNNKIYFYQSGRVMDVPNNIRLGIVLHAYCLRQAIGEGCREYDFLGGVAQYKQKLSLATRPLVEFRVVKPLLKERLRFFSDRGIRLARHIKNWFRSKAKKS